MSDKITIGIDFDNTIVCYDSLVYSVAKEIIDLPEHVLPNKESVRDFLRKSNLETEWTEMQGIIYGQRIVEATPFPGVRQTFKTLLSKNINVVIVSHKTKVPCLGPAFNLHEAAYRWLEANDFFNPKDIALPRTNVFLEETRAEKILRIQQISCNYFIDDLPEVLLDKTLPTGIKKILFNPHNPKKIINDGLIRASSWNEIQQILLAQEM